MYTIRFSSQLAPFVPKGKYQEEDNLKYESQQHDQDQVHLDSFVPHDVSRNIAMVYISLTQQNQEH